MPAIIFLTACWLVIPASSLSLLLTPPLVVIADRVQP
jgi:hypothetical protein